jgi:guanylate kinase
MKQEGMKLLILLGPSASGKTESAKIMINRYPISRVVTATTRPKRASEIDGFDYHFFSEMEFEKRKSQGYFAETAYYNGFRYGTPNPELRDDKLIILEPQGLASFLHLKRSGIVAIYLKTDEETRQTRMQLRGDDQAAIAKRIQQDRIDFALERTQGLDLVIDTTAISLSDLADRIYQTYLRLLEDKK